MKVFTELSLADFRSHDGEPLYPDNLKYKITRVIAEDQNTVNQGDLLFVILPVEIDKV